MTDSSFAFLYLHAIFRSDKFGILKIQERIMPDICLHLSGKSRKKKKNDGTNVVL